MPPPGRWERHRIRSQEVKGDVGKRMLGKRNRPRDRSGRKNKREREREEKRKTVRGRKKEVPTKRQTVPAPGSRWGRGSRIPGSWSEKGAESLPPPQGNRTQEHRDRAGHMWPTRGQEVVQWKS